MALTLRRNRTAAFVAALAAALSWMVAAPNACSPTIATAVFDPAVRAVHGAVSVIVEGGRAADRAVVRSGGVVTRDLPIVGGFAAKVPANDVNEIAKIPGVRSITLNRTTQMQSAPGTYNNLPSVYKQVVKGDKLNKAGGDGRGITVALIDTGVTALPDVANAIVPVSADPLGETTSACANFTDEPTCDDSYGHGTFMAGLIAGNGAASNGKYVGMAPAAKIVSVKIAGATGASDVSTIIAAIQWVVQNQSTYNIRVLNLSLGTDSTQSYTVDPLDFAAEKAWQAGIVVNVAASNRGPAAQTISDPANDPFVVTVGAIDDRGTTALGDDLLPNFSGRGPTATDGLSKPDVVAPGAHLVSLAAPNASITTQFPSTMSAPYRRGSGTSMANAVVSGLVADMLSAQPASTPDRVKYELTSTAHHDASSDPLATGAGIVDGQAALNATPGVANVGVQPSLGTGSIAASRGSTGVVLDDATGTVLTASSGDLTDNLSTFVEGNSWWGNSWWGNSWWGNSWWGASTEGVNDSTQDYGNSWWGGAWYGAWDQ